MKCFICGEEMESGHDYNYDGGGGYITDIYQYNYYCNCGVYNEDGIWFDEYDNFLGGPDE